MTYQAENQRFLSEGLDKVFEWEYNELFTEKMEKMKNLKRRAARNK